jgi:S1-C subfamily serine protease
MTALIRDGVVSYGWIGDNDYVTITPALATRYRLPTGVFIRGVERNSPSERAGLRRSMTITAINGQAVTSREQIDRIIGRQSVGSRVRVEVVDEDDRKSVVEVQVSTRNAPRPAGGRRTL